MAEELGDLTSSESWDEVWRNHVTTSGESGARTRTRKHREWEELLARLLDLGGQESKSVLELGCAPGLMLERLHKQRPHNDYRGVDYAPTGVTLASEHLDRLGIRADLQVGDIRTVETRPADLVMSFGLIEHFDDPTEIAAHHKRLTSTDGFVAVTVPNYAHPVVRRLLSRFSPETLATHNLEIMNPGTIAEVLSAAGLTSVQSGYAGTASIPSSRVRKTFSGRVFGNAARAWNVGTEVLPQSWPWANYVWATGQNS